MKKILFIALVILISVLTANTQGINFYSGSWSDAVAKAQREDKYIVVDCYASWCGPCKYMSNRVFTNSRVGSYYNQNFVCLKIDMEKDFRRDFIRRYGESVTAYPTYFLINPHNLQIVLEGVGVYLPDELIDFARRL